MDFSHTDEQEAVRGLAEQIFSARSAATVDGAKGAGGDGDWMDEDLWRELASANLLGIAIPEDEGGSGRGIIELSLMLEQAGRALARVPLVPTLVAGALPIAAFGTREQRRQILPGVVAGETLLSAALVEEDPADHSHVGTVAEPQGDGWALTGVKTCVPIADRCHRILVPAATPDGGLAVFLLDPRAAGVELQPQFTTSGAPECRIELDGATVGAGDVLGGSLDGARIAAWIRDHAMVGLCALQLGIADQALTITAGYTSEREQFGRPIAAFQAVAMHAANAYIDVETIRSTMLQAAWRLSVGLDARQEVSVAQFFAAEAGQRVVSVAQHLHGGIGVDVDYPIHRYFLWSKQAELSLGSASWHLARLGTSLAG